MRQSEKNVILFLKSRNQKFFFFFRTKIRSFNLSQIVTLLFELASLIFLLHKYVYPSTTVLLHIKKYFTLKNIKV